MADTPNPEEHLEWLSRVRDRQRAREAADPERRIAREREERRSRARLHYQSASEAIYNNAVTSQAWSRGMGEYEQVCLRGGDERRSTVQGAVERMSRVKGLAKRSQARSKARSAILQSATPADEIDQAATAAAADEDDDVYQALEAELELPVPAALPAPGTPSPFGAARRVDVLADAVTPAAESEVRSALEQLRVEPADDEGRAQLFELYEASASTVEENRTGLFEFWSSAEGDFAPHPAVRAALQRQIDRVDRPETMGIVDSPPGVWFVHGMAVQSQKNVTILDSVLREIRSKLELLGAQDECPICLEDLSGIEGGVTSLSCAHSVCTACWQRWTTVSGNSSCPLCRNQAFVSNVYATASALLDS